MSYYPWDVLNIESTTNKKLIKKAYARLLRENKPDEDPEGFILINDAYNEAIRQASDSKPGFYESSVYQTSVQDESDDDSLFLEEFEDGFEAESEEKTKDSPDESELKAIPENWEDLDLDVIEPLSPVVFEHVEQDSWDDLNDKDDFPPPPPPPFSPHQSLTEELEHVLDQEYDDFESSDDEIDDLFGYLSNEDSKLIADIIELIENNNYDIDVWRDVLESPEFLLNKNVRDEVSHRVFEFVLDGVDYEFEHRPDFVFCKDKFTRIASGIPNVNSYQIFTVAKMPLLLLFENVFGWTQDWQSLEFQFGRRTFEITDLLEEKKNELSKKDYSYNSPEKGTKIVGYSHLIVDVWQMISTRDWQSYREWIAMMWWPFYIFVAFIIFRSILD